MREKNKLLLMSLILILSLTTAIQLNRNIQTLVWIMPQSTVVAELNSKGLEISLGPETQINTYTDYFQGYVKVCCRPDGSFVAVWQSNHQTAEKYNIYAKIFNSTGHNITDEILVNTNTTEDQEYPSVGCFSNNSFVVTWDHYGVDGTDVYAKIFDETGVNLTGDILINSYQAGGQNFSNVCCINDTNFIVTWCGEGPGEPSGIYACVFNMTGGNVTTHFQVNQYLASNTIVPSISCFSNGSFVITWLDGSQDGSGSGIYAQIFDLNGNNRTSSDIKVNTITSGSQNTPNLCCLSDGSFIITWFGNGTGDPDGIFAKIFNSSAVNITDEILINSNTAGIQFFPDICCYNDNSFLITWYHQRGLYTDVYVSYFDSNGNKRTADTRVNSNTSTTNSRPKICCSNGSFVIVYNYVPISSMEVAFRIGSFIEISEEINIMPILILLMGPETETNMILIVILIIVAAVVVILVIIYFKIKKK
ncbi:MAG: hypothetical protein ACFFDN_16115 [Candidatus Hodarchaeota archaeon]